MPGTGKKLANGTYVCAFGSGAPRLPDPDKTATAVVMDDGDTLELTYEGTSRTYLWNAGTERYEWEPPWTGGPYPVWWIMFEDATGADLVTWERTVGDLTWWKGGWCVQEGE